MLVDTTLVESLVGPHIAVAGGRFGLEVIAVDEREVHHHGGVAAEDALQHLLVVAGLAVVDAVPGVGAARTHVELGVLQGMDGEDEVLCGVAAAVG